MWGAKQPLVSVWTLCTAFDHFLPHSLTRWPVVRTKVGRTMVYDVVYDVVTSHRHTQSHSHKLYSNDTKNDGD